MGNFMRKHRCHLGLAVGGGKKTCVHADKAARQGEGVDRVVAHCEELEVLSCSGSVLREARAEVAEVIGDLRIVEVVRVAKADVAHDALADAPLGCGASPASPLPPRSGKPWPWTAVTTARTKRSPKRMCL